MPKKHSVKITFIFVWTSFAYCRGFSCHKTKYIMCCRPKTHCPHVRLSYFSFRYIFPTYLCNLDIWYQKPTLYFWRFLPIFAYMMHVTKGGGKRKWYKLGSIWWLFPLNKTSNMSEKSSHPEFLPQFTFLALPRIPYLWYEHGLWIHDKRD